MPIKAVLFDFDGTLVETRTASWELFEETNREFKLGLDTREKFFQIFEGNFYDSLIRHCQDEAVASAAATHFMELVRERYHPPFIPGMVTSVSKSEISSACASALMSASLALPALMTE